jgi:hypothetical protein
MTSQDLTHFARVVVSCLWDSHAEMKGMTATKTKAFVLKILADNEIVFGVWQDADEPNGIGVLLIKGKARLEASLRDVCASGVFVITTKVSAVPCACYEQALALQQAYGDKLDA